MTIRKAFIIDQHSAGKIAFNALSGASLALYPSDTVSEESEGFSSAVVSPLF
jgi:hypothetical protein